MFSASSAVKTVQLKRFPRAFVHTHGSSKWQSISSREGGWVVVETVVGANVVVE